MQYRILQSGPLLNEKGALIETGYALHPLKKYDRSMVKAPSDRIREQDSYFISNDYCAFTITIGSFGTSGVDSIQFIDFASSTRAHANHNTKISKNGRDLPPSPLSGTIRAIGSKYEFTIRSTENERHIYGHMYNFGPDARPFLFDFILYTPPQESIVTISSLPRLDHGFLLSHKTNALRVDGRIIYEDREYLFSPAASFASFKWERGAWPRQSSSFWGTANGMVHGHPFGINIGSIDQSESTANENAIFYNGSVHKLDQIRVEPMVKESKTSLKTEYTITDQLNRLILHFTPSVDEAIQFRRMFRSGLRYRVYGFFSGTAKLDNGSLLHIERIPGLLEKSDHH